MLIFQIKRIISSEKWFNYVVTFFLKKRKIWVGRTTLNGEKKEDGLTPGLVLFRFLNCLNLHNFDFFHSARFADVSPIQNLLCCFSRLECKLVMIREAILPSS